MTRTTATVFDVAEYIMRKYAPMAKKSGPMTAMKLQKLVYYSQAWSLVWDEEPLFKDKIEAWVYGPVVRTLFELNRGRYEIHRLPPSTDNQSTGDPTKLSEDQRETIDLIVKGYGKLTPEALTERTHEEPPWQKARDQAGLGPTERGNTEILHNDMKEYYSSIS